MWYITENKKKNVKNECRKKFKQEKKGKSKSVIKNGKTKRVINFKFN